MSYYTDAEHAVAIILTRKWSKHRPVTAVEFMEYGRFQLRMKDFEEARRWFLGAADKGCGEAWFYLGLLAERPDVEQKPGAEHLSADKCWEQAWKCIGIHRDEYLTAKVADDHMRNVLSWKLYQAGYMLRYGKGTQQNAELAHKCFCKITEILSKYDVEDFRVSTVYTIYGSRADRPIEACLLPLGEAWYELALYYLEGTEPCIRNREKACELLMRAYNCHCEKGLLKHYSIFRKSYEDYEYKDEIRELCAFRIGRYGRAAEVNPSGASWKRLYCIYQEGFPGDDALRREEFLQKADTWKRMIWKRYQEEVLK